MLHVSPQSQESFKDTPGRRYLPFQYDNRRPERFHLLK